MWEQKYLIEKAYYPKRKKILKWFLWIDFLMAIDRVIWYKGVVVIHVIIMNNLLAVSMPSS